MRCKATAGLLFPRQCDQPAGGQCQRCARPVCQAHVRQGPSGEPLCMTCVREGLREQRHRGSYAHLRDDPYFFWYFTAGLADDFTASDYLLFGDTGGGDFDASFERDWGGS